MESLKFSVFSILLVTTCCVALVNSQISPGGGNQNNHAVHQPNNMANMGSSQNPQDQMVLPSQLEVGEAPVTNHYPYQSTQLAPSGSYHQPYSGSNYGRDVYNSNREGWGWYPYFGINAGTAWELSAYFGQVFWGVVIVMATFGACVVISKFFIGGNLFGGIFQRIKDSTPAARALDLDNVTNMVYQALDTYGKLVAKDVQQGTVGNLKG